MTSGPTVPSTPWRKSSRSGPFSDNCVEVCATPDSVKIRSDHRPEKVICFTTDGWRQFCDAIKRCTTEGLDGLTLPVGISFSDDRITLTSSAGNTVWFDRRNEWSRFAEGVIDGEFDNIGSIAPAESPQ